MHLDDHHHRMVHLFQLNHRLVQLLTSPHYGTGKILHSLTVRAPPSSQSAPLPLCREPVVCQPHRNHKQAPFTSVNASRLTASPPRLACPTRNASPRSKMAPDRAKLPALSKDSVFASLEQFKQAARTHAMEHHFTLKVQHSKSTWAVVVCSNSACAFRVRARVNKKNPSVVNINTFTEGHVCAGAAPPQRASHSKHAYLVDLLSGASWRFNPNPHSPSCSPNFAASVSA